MFNVIFFKNASSNPYAEAIKIYSSSEQWVNPDEILAEAWAKCLDEEL